MVEMVVHRVVMNQQGNAFVLLSDLTGERLLPIWIGPFEAHSIAMKLQDEVFERPLTHDLFVNTIHELGYELTKIEVTKLEDKIFYALIHLQGNGTEVKVDSRPSDAIGLAVRVDARIFVDDQVLTEAQLFRHEIDDSAGEEKFKELINSLQEPTPDEAFPELPSEPEDEESSTEDDK